MATARSGKARRKRSAGFTMIELLIAFGLMVILLTTVYVIFDTGSKVFGKSAARLEIMELARTVFHLMERDLTGATLDMDGRVFRGYSFAYHGNAWFGGRKIFGLPALNSDWRRTSYWLWQNKSYNVSYNFSDFMWFRTTTAPESRGGQAEIIYRLADAGGGGFAKYYYGGTLERAVRVSWPASTGNRTDPNGPYLKPMENRSDAVNCPVITPCPLQEYNPTSTNTAMEIVPLAPFCYELRIDYMDAFSFNTRAGKMHRFHDGISVDYGYSLVLREAWPPRGAWPGTARGPLSEFRLWNRAQFTANECRRHLPAAVKVYCRLGDMRQAIWSDNQLDFGSWQRKQDGQVQVDEVGMVFEQWFFLPNHIRFPYAD